VDKAALRRLRDRRAASHFVPGFLKTWRPSRPGSAVPTRCRRSASSIGTALVSTVIERVGENTIRLTNALLKLPGTFLGQVV
jgi:hypothetical protein